MQRGKALRAIRCSAPYPHFVELAHMAKSLQMCLRLNSTPQQRQHPAVVGCQVFRHRRYELLVLQDFGNVGLGQSEDHRTISYYAKSTLGMEDHVRVWHDSDEPITAGYVRSLGEAVKVTPPAKWRFCGCRRETFGTDQCFTCSSARIGDSRRKTPDLFAYLG